MVTPSLSLTVDSRFDAIKREVIWKREITCGSLQVIIFELIIDRYVDDTLSPTATVHNPIGENNTNWYTNCHLSTDIINQFRTIHHILRTKERKRERQTPEGYINERFKGVIYHKNESTRQRLFQSKSIEWKFLYTSNNTISNKTSRILCCTHCSCYSLISNLSNVTRRYLRMDYQWISLLFDIAK